MRLLVAPPTPAFGEPVALLFPAFELPGSGLGGVGCSSIAGMLAFLELRGPPFVMALDSECKLRGGETEAGLGGGEVTGGVF